MNLYQCCYKCEKRKLGCHGTCTDYKNDRAKNDEINDIKALRRDSDGYIKDAIYKKYKQKHLK